MKKHIRSNYKNLLINFFAMVLSLFALIGTINIIASENKIYEALDEEKPCIYKHTCGYGYYNLDTRAEYISKIEDRKWAEEEEDE